MANDPNPYEAPQFQEPGDDSILSRLKRFVFGQMSFHDRFIRGEVVIQYGVMIFVVPQIPDRLFAAIPFGTVDEDRAQQNYQEAKREACKLFHSHPELHRDLSKRELVVQLIPSYREYEEPICDKVFEDWYKDDWEEPDSE
ncbi:MAG: hypothetical protein AAGA30_16000 [Planctomycetota bacterium]